MVSAPSRPNKILSLLSPVIVSAELEPTTFSKPLALPNDAMSTVTAPKVSEAPIMLRLSTLSNCNVSEPVPPSIETSSDKALNVRKKTSSPAPKETVSAPWRATAIVAGASGYRISLIGATNYVTCRSTIKTEAR